MAVFLFRVEKKIQFDRVKYFDGLVLLAISLCLVTSSPIKFLLLPIFSILLILRVSTNENDEKLLDKILSSKLLVSVGAVSYGIYIYHFPIIRYIDVNLFQPYFWSQIEWGSLGVLAKFRYYDWIIQLPLYSVLSFVVAKLSFRFFEQPILGLKDKWFGYK